MSQTVKWDSGPLLILGWNSLRSVVIWHVESMTSTWGIQTKPSALENIVAIPSQLWGGTASGVGWPGETRANPSTVSGIFSVPAMLQCCHDVMLKCEFE